MVVRSSYRNSRVLYMHIFGQERDRSQRVKNDGVGSRKGWSESSHSCELPRSPTSGRLQT